MTNGTGATRDIVQKLWNLCNILRDDGITYTDYVIELTFLLFLKMLAETGREERLSEKYRWGNLARRQGHDQLEHYRQMLFDLGNTRKTKDRLVLGIFSNAQTKLRKPANLKALTNVIDGLNWFSAREEGLGNLYEGLLEKNAAEKKSGAGQYFTPRPLIDSIVRRVKPKAGEVIQDPAAGAGGFLVAANRYISDHTNHLNALNEEEANFQRNKAFRGMELVPDTHRLLLMNLMLHGIEGTAENGDSLSPDGQMLGKADVVLSNPPFGMKKGGGRPTRTDFSVTADTSNKQLAFVEHIVRALNPGGRAAIVLPDNVLFEDNTGKRLRTWMMDLCDIHTILRLPTGIFYAQGVKTNVVFLTRGDNDKGNTRGTWMYDMRTNMDSFGKSRLLTEADFAAFEQAFGEDEYGQAPRIAEGKEGRFQYFSRKHIADRRDNLDISWLKDTSEDSEDEITEPEQLTTAIASHLRTALEEIKAYSEKLTKDMVENSL